MNAPNLIPLSTSFPAQLSHLAGQLGQAVDDYCASPATDETRGEAVAFVATSYLFFKTLLPGSSGEVHDALVGLCVSETARRRLQQQADSGALPGARVLDIVGDGQ